MYDLSWLPDDVFDFGIELKDFDEVPPTKREAGLCKVEKQAEYKCIRCKDWFKDVEPNQPNNEFKCFLCRTYTYR